MNDEPITDSFNRYFSLTEPRTPEEREAAYRLRYEVYCREFQFEREEDCPGQREADAYDDQSWHCLLRHIPSAFAAGSVRVVHVDADDPIPDLPMERNCRDSFFDVPQRPDRLDRGSICEVSRLAVHGLFRRRAGDPVSPIGDPAALDLTPEQTRVFPILAVSLFVAATVVCVRENKRHAFAMMEPALARILRRTGLEFTQIGAKVDYHGERAAFYIDSGEAHASLMRSESLGPLCTRLESSLDGGTEASAPAGPRQARDWRHRSGQRAA